MEGKDLIGKEPIKKVNVDEAVTLGAAIKAGLVMVEQKPEAVSDNIKRALKETKFIDVANHSYGKLVMAYDETLQKDVEVNSIITPKNTPLPCSISESFYTKYDNQQGVDFTLTQGEGKDPEFIDLIFKTKLEGLPPNRPKGQKIEITYEYDTSGRMHCIFKDVASGVSKEVDIHLGENKPSSDNVDSFIVE